ncbi:MAG: TIGR04282 family arsenosugar biosynthesis glycosyltransferase [Gammaproteobacteria bacterium]
MSAALILFAKPPALAKRRLAADLGRPIATRIAAALLDDALARGTASTLEQRYFYWAGALMDAEPMRAKHLGYRLVKQTGASLGARMQQAFTEVLEDNDAALLIGTDCPDLDAGRIAHAARLLGANDAVLIPAYDGGYVAIGLTQRAAPVLTTVFNDIVWGDRDVAERTRANLRRANLTAEELAPLADLDDSRDLARAATQHRFLADALQH